MIVLQPLPLASTTHKFSIKSTAYNNPATFGGPTQRISKPGDKYTLAVSSGSLSYPQAQAYMSAVLQGLSTQTVRYYFPIGYTVGGIGSPVVDGPNQTGTNLDIRGSVSGYQFEVGGWFTLTTTAGYSTLHSLTNATEVASDTTATIAFLPELRTSPSDGDTLTFDTPFVEGWLTADSQDWTYDTLMTAGISFSITER